MNITKFRKKPVVIEAVRWSGNNLREVINFTGLHPSANKWSWEEYEQVVAREGLKIFTLEGPLIATEGDWIIRGLRGEYYPCKCDIFEATYDPADATSEHTRLTSELAEKEGEIERLEQQVCDACNGDGWIYNRVEGRGACVCMTEAEPFQILLNALERIAGGKCQTGASWSEAKEALRAVLPLDYE